MDVNNIDRRLRRQIDEVATRFRRLRTATALAVLWIVLATCGAILLALNHSVGLYVRGEIHWFLAAGVIATAVVGVLAWRVARDPRWVARRIEQKYPQLDARLLTAIEQQPEAADGQYGFLQYQVIQEALFHGYQHDWRKTLPRSAYTFAHLACLAASAAYVVAALGLFWHLEPHPFELRPLLGLGKANVEAPAPTVLKSVEPGNTEIEKGTSLLVLAKFSGRLPLECTLVATDGAENSERQVEMVQSLSDPLYGGRIPIVDKALSYHVQYGDSQSDEYHVTVFEYPALQTADAVLDFPDYTGHETKTVQDVRHITAVEGTSATLLFHLNKPVHRAALADRQGEEIELTAVADDPATRTTTLTLTESQRYTLHLRDDAAQKQATAGVRHHGHTKPSGRTGSCLSLARCRGIADRRTAAVGTILGRLWPAPLRPQLPAGRRRTARHHAGAAAAPKGKLTADYLLAFEDLEAQPNQLLSYHFWVEDVDSSGEPRRHTAIFSLPKCAPRRNLPAR